MRKIIGFLVLWLIMAGQVLAAEDSHTFFANYDPTSGTTVFEDDYYPTGTATGDEFAVNTFSKKSIQISTINILDEVEIYIQGRVKDETANWATLSTVSFGVASADTSKNKVVDITEYVDFLRIGMRSTSSQGVSHINVRGIFTNINR